MAIRATIVPHAHRYTRRAAIALYAMVAVSACRESTGLSDQRVNAAVLAGDAQFGTANTTLADPLQVVVTDAVTNEPREGITVTWAVTGTGATVTPQDATTDTRGIASADVRLGATLGTTNITAKAANQVGDPVTFTVTTVDPPSITSVSPGSANAGDTITVTGANFGSTQSALAVLFDGVRGQIVSSSSAQLRVVVPPCIASRNSSIRVALGAVESGAATISTTARADTSLRLNRGEVRVFADPAALSCVRLPAGLTGATYMLIPQNVTETYSIPMDYELTAFGVVTPLALRASSFNLPPTARRNFASDWEINLRERERALGSNAGPLPIVHLRENMPDLPKVGDRRSFNTLNANNETVKITAEVRAVTQHAILYQDLDAADVLTTADYQRFGNLFDDPIYDTDTAVFGSVSDVDGNGHVIIVLTPQVNKLTPKKSGSFIAGYFYACDLLPKNKCSATNNGEIFYSMVPDLTGKFGDFHSAASVLGTVPPVVAHEFMHMINFSQRGSLDALWLAEALAHTAEDIVGQVFLDRGDATTAAQFIEDNHGNARAYLADIENTSLIADETPGTIELRGAGWLFLRYLRGLYGENALLGELTRSQTSGSENITSHTGKTWATLMSDFATAIYADDAPELAGVTLDSRYTFVNTNMREMLGTGAPFPLAIHNHAFGDFTAAGSLPSSSWAYHYVQGSTLPNASLNLIFSGALGGAFAPTSSPQLTLLRVK